MISSANVEAWAYSFIARVANFAMKLPPMPKMAIIAGTREDRINANFHCFTNAITNAEKKDAREDNTMAILIQ